MRGRISGCPRLCRSNHAEILLGKIGAERQRNSNNLGAVFDTCPMGQIRIHSGGLALQRQILNPAVGSGKNFDRAVRSAHARTGIIRSATVLIDQRNLGILADYHKQSRKLVRSADAGLAQQVNREVDRLIIRYKHKDAVVPERAVERSNFPVWLLISWYKCGSTACMARYRLGKGQNNDTRLAISSDACTGVS